MKTRYLKRFFSLEVKTFCSRPMRSRDFPLALAFSRLEETEKTATQARPTAHQWGTSENYVD